MRKYNVGNVMVSTLTAAFVILGATSIAHAQVVEEESLVCYTVTSLPSLGMVTSSDDPPVEVLVGEFYAQPPVLVYRAPDTAGLFTMGYDVNNLEMINTGVFQCSETTTQLCGPSNPGNQFCPINEFCAEVIDTVCNTTPVLDSATITFNINDDDTCTPEGRDIDCEPDANL